MTALTAVPSARVGIRWCFLGIRLGLLEKRVGRENTENCTYFILV